MKRPEGFDGRYVPPASAVDEPAGKVKVTRERRAPRTPRAPASVDPHPSPAMSGSPLPADRARSAAAAERGAKAELRRAARRRRRYERQEMRRFTRRTRRRRITWLVTGALVLAMFGLVAIAVFSPLLALREIRVDGTSRLSAPDIVDAVDSQLDTPLALLDMDEMTRQLGDFPLIRSFVTETVPPDTLVIHILERQPIGSLQTAGGYSLVDPAGVEIEKSVERIPGVPLIDTGGADASSEAFTAAVEVLVAMPDSVLSQLDTISARTRDDVAITLASGGARIVWGSADDSEYKARVLQVALSKNFPGVTEYNVSAPGQLTYR